MSTREIKTFVIVAIAIGVIWAISFFAIFAVVKFGFGSGLAETGLIGDTFGAINSLFSGLALAGVLGALYLQGKEIKEARGDAVIQTEIASISTLLSVLSGMIEWEQNHLQTHHLVELAGVDPHTSNLSGLEKRLEASNRRHREHGGNNPHTECFHKNMENLISYRKQTGTLYERLLELQKKQRESK